MNALEDKLEQLNMKALEIARDVADRTGTLMAGNVSNTCIYDVHENPESQQKVRDMYKVLSSLKYTLIQGNL